MISLFKQSKTSCVSLAITLNLPVSSSVDDGDAIT